MQGYTEEVDMPVNMNAVFKRCKAMGDLIRTEDPLIYARRFTYKEGVVFVYTNDTTD